jgi:lambda repressor-like predicted transcriptional regulator
MYGNNLKRVMEEKGITPAELSRETGIGRSSLSQYLHGKNVPTEARKLQIAYALEVDPAELEADPAEREAEVTPVCDIPKIPRISVERAAVIMGMSHETVRKGLRQGVFPWGYGILTSDNQWCYFINAKSFAEKEGLSLRDVLDVEPTTRVTTA